MFRWYLVTHKFQALELVTSIIDDLGVEHYSPVKTKMMKRRDCNGIRRSNSPLFPGYLFVKLNTEIVHTSEIGIIPGVQDFVRFGTEIATVSSSVVDALKQSLHLLSDTKVTSIESHNIPSEMLSAISDIAAMDDELERQVAFYNLIQNDANILSRGSLKHSKVAWDS